MIISFRERIANFIYPEGRDRRNKIERELNRDPLTGVANRRAFDLALADAEGDELVSLVVFDANNFGLQNKINGFTAGDEMIKEIAIAISSAAAAVGFPDRVFRLGGDEFVALVTVNKAWEFLTQAEANFGVRPINDEFEVSLTGSIGKTFEAADSILQTRKRARKQAIKIAKSPSFA